MAKLDFEFAVYITPPTVSCAGCGAGEGPSDVKTRDPEFAAIVPGVKV